MRKLLLVWKRSLAVTARSPVGLLALAAVAALCDASGRQRPFDVARLFTVSRYLTPTVTRRQFQLLAPSAPAAHKHIRASGILPRRRVIPVSPHQRRVAIPSHAAHYIKIARTLQPPNG